MVPLSALKPPAARDLPRHGPPPNSLTGMLLVLQLDPKSTLGPRRRRMTLTRPANGGIPQEQPLGKAINNVKNNSRDLLA